MAAMGYPNDLSDLTNCTFTIFFLHTPSPPKIKASTPLPSNSSELINLRLQNSTTVPYIHKTNAFSSSLSTESTEENIHCIFTVAI